MVLEPDHVGLQLKPVFQNREVQERLVGASGLDRTIVRPRAFPDGVAAGLYREASNPSERRLKLSITRADVAGFLARQIGQTRDLHRAVAISN